MLAVELKNISKRFGAVRANDGVSLRVEPGTIHGVIGENGAGKSTAMKILYGLYTPDGGEVRIHGRPCAWNSPSDAIRAGVGMVHQHFMLAGPYSALDNIVLGAEPWPTDWRRRLPRFLRPVARREARAHLEALASQYGLPVDWDRPVEELPVGIQQRIEILKLLYRNANILILDEPTAVLTPQEVRDLFVNLRKLRDEGKTILLITHKLKEVMEITDQVTVFRAGKVTGERKTSETNPSDLAELMVGRKVVLTVEAPPAARSGGVVLNLDNVSAGLLESISLQVRGGEVVGIAGVEGNGQSDLLHLLNRPAEFRPSGRIQVLGKDVTDWPARRIRDLGVGFVPEDRHREGLILDASVEENFLLGLQGASRFGSRGLIRRREVRHAAVSAMDRFDVRPRDPDIAIGGLSGGNQQKLIIAREFEREPKLLIVAQPTRGVDVGAIEFIHRRILEARAAGTGVLLVSSELDEVMALSDRILVMYEGRIVAEFARGEADDRRIGLYMGGGRE